MRKPRLDSDRAARRLISHRRMAADLVRLLGDRWIEDVDLDRLERLPSEHVSPARRSRREDMPWWTAFKAGAGYGPSAKVLFQIEFQSRPDPFMAERMLEYNAMLRLDLLRAGTTHSRGERSVPAAPASVSIVVYTGAAPVDVADERGGTHVMGATRAGAMAAAFCSQAS